MNNIGLENNEKNAIILAAGYGMRMVPINMETPKALLEVNGERLIERLIRQLKEAGIKDITIVVGFMKEKFKYLEYKEKVKLVENEQYNLKNNLYSLSLVSNKLLNTYIIPCDIWCRINPFKKYNLDSWYMISNNIVDDSKIILNENNEIILSNKVKKGNAMVGISYLNKEDSKKIKKKLDELSQNKLYDNSFWEDTLYDNMDFECKNNKKMFISARLVDADDFIEINTYEQLRNLDRNSIHLKTDAIDLISKIFSVDTSDIVDIAVLKKGMTNRSFLFSCKGKKYIMRIPGEGTDKLINRYNESKVYDVIAGKGLCDDLIYINPKNGYKIAKYIEGVRVCDPYNESDVYRCMNKLKTFHDLNLKVNHEFDVFNQIDFYEKLRGEKSIYDDYEIIKSKIIKLKEFIEKNIEKKVLTHIDAVPDNFLFYIENSKEKLQLTDWEYAGMQDPHIDLAMFSIYSFYDKEQIDKLISIYFEGCCKKETKIKIYCYIASCGLLWSNWCEYKKRLGIEFGEYSEKQYDYAKIYCDIAIYEMKKIGVCI